MHDVATIFINSKPPKSTNAKIRNFDGMQIMFTDAQPFEIFIAINLIVTIEDTLRKI